MDECASDPCLNGAHCTDSTDSQHRRMQAAAAGAYLCRCRHGFEGDECQTNTDECASRPCLHGSHCVDMTDAFTCHCSAGWSGDVCEVEVNECESSPCQNAGRCLDGVDTYSCDCAAGWLGSTCGEEVDACQRGEGTCDVFHSECIHTGLGTFDCECFPGFETADAGHTCTDINECASRPCRNAGRCTDELSSYLCECDLGYVGVNCAENVDDCASLPCFNDGVCTDGSNAYLCRCEAGFSGVQCEYNIDECEDQRMHGEVCLNGGTCEDLVNSYRCQCTAGFIDEHCERDFDECVSHPCGNGGFCAEVDSGLYRCECLVAYEGENCETQRTAGAWTFDYSIECGTTVEGTTVGAESYVTHAGGEAIYGFSVPQGQHVVQFDGCRSQFDTYLRIMTADLQSEIAGCDDCGPCGSQTVLDTVMQCSAPSCPFALVVGGAGAEEGLFSIDLQCASVGRANRSIDCGATVTGSYIHQYVANGDDQFFVFSSLTRMRVQFDSCQSTFDTVLRILSADMTYELHSCDNCGDCGTRSVLDADMDAGEYVLVVGGSGNGDYSVTMNCPDDGFVDGTLDCGDTVTGTTVESSSHFGEQSGDHIYEFSLTRGAHFVQFDSCASQFDTFLRVMSADLSIELAACDDCGPCGDRTVLDLYLTCDAATCNYALIIEGYSGNEGAYSVTMNCASSQTQVSESISCGQTKIGSTVGASSVTGNAGGDHMYTFVLAEDGLVQFDSCASSYDTFIRIFSGNFTTELESCDDCGEVSAQPLSFLRLFAAFHSDCVFSDEAVSVAVWHACYS